jgi:hypothetical protein
VEVPGSELDGSEQAVCLALGYNVRKVQKSSDQGVGYMENRNLYRTNQMLRARAGLPIVLLIVLGTGGAVWGQTQSAGAGESLAAWGKIVTVLQHPRCLNCHQLNSPLQEDSRRMHIPHVVRGADSHGVGPMRCGNCHNDGNNLTSRTPGAPEWSLAPVSMLWQGLSSGDLCRMLKDSARNGKRSPEALVEHMSSPLVLWGWNPGPGLEPVPIPHAEFINLMKVWVAGGTACPK